MNTYFNLKFYRFPKMIKQYERCKIKYSKLTKTDMNWFTGFWEGEGCIAHLSKFSLRFTLAQKDKTPLIFVKKLLKAGTILHKDTQKNTFYSYELNGTGRVISLLKIMLPYMKSKKRITETKKTLKILDKIIKKSKYYKDCLERE